MFYLNLPNKLLYFLRNSYIMANFAAKIYRI
uniref:Uncharacterized protein n=1 Tax=Siphoviridae sp. ctAUQ2 TaxID=2826182 RepID=A0A8S5MZU1_9CAUD|nr:MAG TPA: hypothetical protein [Siphoviridae sp. ctAUQ2]